MNSTDDILLTLYIGLFVGTFLRNTGRYRKAIEIFKECLVLLNTKVVKMRKLFYLLFYTRLSLACQDSSDSRQAINYGEKALAIRIDINDKLWQCPQYGILGHAYWSLGEYVKAREYLEKALAIRIEIGDRRGEQNCYGNLGRVYRSLGEYVKAKTFIEKALAISIEIGDRKGEGSNYENLGTVFQCLGDYVKAREFLEKALAVSTEIGDRRGKGTCYGNFGNMYQYLGEYVKAKEFVEKALAISIEIGERFEEGTLYGNLGNLYQYLGESAKAREFHKKAIAISIEIGNRRGEEANYGNLGAVYQSLGEYVKAREFLEKALAISIEISDRRREGLNYTHLGSVYQSLGDYGEARRFYEKGLAICIEIGDRHREAECYLYLGKLCSFWLGCDGLAEEYYKKGLAIAIELGTVDTESKCQYGLAFLYVSMMRKEEAFACLSAAVERFEDLRGFLGEHDKYKVNFADGKSVPYLLLTVMLCCGREINEALLVSELGRARALADLMSAQYSLKALSNRLVLVDIQQIMRNEKSICTGVYIYFVLERMYFWIIKANKKVLFKDINKEALGAISNCHESTLQNYVESLANQSYRNLTVLLGGECEDRSLFTFYESEAECQAHAEEKPASCRLVEEYEEEREQEPALRSLYKVIISPVEDLLEGSEIIICPPPAMYQVPFSALMVEDERYLSEKFRIRLIPSLTTLKQIQNSPANYHSQTGVLIVGDPDVGRSDISRLPGAKEEAEMIGRLLHAQPLIGRAATKQAVLQSMRSVSLIHIAAHGDAKRGEIALAPLRPMHRIPVKEDFMLTMSDVSEVQLRAKLVVLSCCHSGRGEIRAEGVIGIARAFLGSGARSVLVSLWAVDDRATKEFMRQFYEHLSRGESASECLHEAMKWMRGHPQYCAVRQWAPFVLIGDNVTFNFKELTRDQLSNST